VAQFAGTADFTDTTDAAALLSALDLDLGGALTGFTYDFDNDTFTFGGDAEYLVALELTVGGNLIEVGGAAAKATIDISGGNPFSGDNPTIVFGADFDSFFDFNNLTPTAIINTLANFIGWIEDATGSSLLSDIEIPFVEGGLDDLANLAQVLSNALIFDFGGDNVRDGADKLLTDFNNALQAAGLDAFLRAIPGSVVGEIDLELLDGVASVDINGSSLDATLGNGNYGGTITLGGLELTGILSGALTASFTVNLNGGRAIQKEFELSVEDMADNIGLGDDLPKLLDAFNIPTFDSVQDFLGRLSEIGVLGDAFAEADLSNFYDPVEDQLTYEIAITDKPIFDVELPADFNLDLGSLLNVQSDTRLVLSGMGSVGLVLGFDLTSSPGVGDLPGVSGDLEGTTPLSTIGVEPKTQPAVTGTSDPASVQGILSSDAGFTLDIIDTSTDPESITASYDILVESSATTDNTTIDHLVIDINNALNAVFDDPDGNPGTNDSLLAADRVSVNHTDGRLVFTGGSNIDKFAISVASGDPALGAFGLQPTQSASADGGTASLTAAVPVPTLIGVLNSDAPITLQLNGAGGATETYVVTVSAEDTFKLTLDGEVQNVNRNIIDLVADVQTALGEAKESGAPLDTDPSFDLNDIIEVGFQGKFLVLSLKEGVELINTPETIDGFDVTAADARLGLPTGSANTDDLLIRFDNGETVGIDITDFNTDGNLDIDDVLAAITNADLSGVVGATGSLSAIITPDDAATPENEGGKSLTISYDNGTRKLLAIEATNGSSAAAQLGIIGIDFNDRADPGTPEAEADGSITGRAIGGVTLADRFFITSPSGGSLENIASFEFNAEAGRLIKDLRLVSDDDVLVSDSVDLRAYADSDLGDDEYLEIEIKNVNGFADGTYRIGAVVSGIDADGDGTADEFGVKILTAGGGDADLGTDGLAGGVGVINTGVDASAALGFIEVNLDGTADFQAEASIGLNTGNAAVSDGTVTLAEVIEQAESGNVLDLFRIPSVAVPSGDTDFGGVDLTLSIGSGSDGFDAIINDILPGNSAAVTIDILALGDPFMKTRFDQAGGFSFTDSDTFTVNSNATLNGLLIEGAKLRFTLDTGDVFDAKMDSVSDSGGVITVDLVELTKVEGPAPESDPALDAGTITDVVLLPSADVTLPDIGAIFENPFADFGIDQILDALELLVDFLLDFEQFDFLDQPIPVLDKSVSDLLGMAQDLADYIDELRANPSDSLQFLEDAINDAIGLSGATLADVFDVVNDQALGTTLDDALSGFNIGWDNTKEMLTLTLNIGAGFSESLNVGFSEMGFGDLFADIGIDGLLDFSGSAGLEASGGIFLNLGLGIDINQWSSDPTALTDAVYILDSSAIDAALEVAGTNLAFNAGLGPFALAIQNSESDDAEIEIEVGAEVAFNDSLDEWDDGRIAISQLIGGGVSFTDAFNITGSDGAESFGTVSGTLPVFFPNDANLVGTIRIGEAAGSGAPSSGLGDLLNFGNLTFTTDSSGLSAAEATLTDGNSDNDALVVDISDLVGFFQDFDFSSFSLFDNIKLAVDGFDSFLQLLEDSVFGALGDLNIPLVGAGFADAASFIADFRVDFVGPLREAIDTVEDAADDFTDPDKNIISKLLFDLLGPDGLDLLLELDPLDKPGDLTAGLSPEDFIMLDSDALASVLFDGEDLSIADIAWDFKIGQTGLGLENAGFGFDIGIPGLGLRTDAEIDATLGWELELGFGLSTQDGFYLDVENEDGTPELVFNVDVTPTGSITGELGFLALTATTAERDIDGEAGNESTGLSAFFGIDLFDSNLANDDTSEDENRLGLTEFGDIGLELSAEVTAAAVLDMVLGLNSSLVGDAVASGFPSIVADFDFLWSIDFTGENAIPLIGGDTSPDFGSVLGDSLKVLAFNDVGLDLGEFITEVLGPIVDAVSEYTAPLQPFIDFLTTPIPVIDAFGVNLTMLDLAAALGDFDAGLIENLAEIITLINAVADFRLNSPDELVIPLGDFVLFGPGQTDNPYADDFDRADAFADRVKTGGFAVDDSTVDSFLASVIDDSGASDKDKNAAKTVQKLKKPGGAFAFPILEDPTQVFGLLMGESPVLVTYDLEPLIVGFEQNFFFSIFGPLGVSLGLIIEFTADFAFGYDTLGIEQFVENDFKNPLQLFNGFYISDTENPDGSGADVPELIFLGGITAAAELNLGIARAGVAGGLFIEILFDLFDPDDDGRVRINELISNVENQLRAPGAEKALAPLAIFDVTGEIFARLFAFLKIDFGFFEIDKEFDIVDPITLLDFEIDFFRPPVVASEAQGDLIINVGAFADQRLLGDTRDFGETVTVRKLSEGGGKVKVGVFTVSNGFGSDSPTESNLFEYELDAGGTIVIDAGAGDDNIYLDGWQGNEVVFDIRGGLGDDHIEFTNSVAGDFNSPFNIIDGGAGADTIIGSNGRDYITGGAGDDTIDAKGGKDVVVADQVDIFGSALVVNVLGNDGADVITGGSDEDILFGGGGKDKVVGGAGNDLILADGGTVAFNNAIDLTSDVDSVLPLLGNVKPLHEGGVSGTDNLGEGVADEIFGDDEAGSETGDDIIFASGGNDEIDAGKGADVVFGGAGFDDIIGGAGADLLVGDVGSILGPIVPLTNTDNLSQRAKQVGLAADGAGDTIYGGDDNDLIFAGSGNDEVYAGAGDDLVFGGAGADYIEGGADNDDLRGESQGDTIYGDDADGLLTGNDIINGGTGPDLVFGGLGDDKIISTKGSDVVNAGEGNDTYVVNLAGGTTTSFIDIVDGGPDTDTDRLEVNGTDRDDTILIRSDLSGQFSFIAGINGEFDVERINYGDTIERIIINGGAGDDFIVSDDTSAVIEVNGESGDDRFQIGQLFRTPRFTNIDQFELPIDTGILEDDFFGSIEVTRGWLSNGISEPMTINGGIGDDTFTVYHNKAVLSLNGDEGDDIFEVRAFALAGSQEPQRERTDLSGGAGADTIRYAVNAPVNINGGDGFDTLIVIGTEFGDDFVITDDGVFGAGLNVNFVNIESLRVDGAEGDDRFFLQSTKETVFTELFGGLGNDTFNASGDTPPVVSNDFRGHSGIITHDIESTDSLYNDQSLFGISANVGDNDEPFAIITESHGATIINEGDAVGDSYEIVLTQRPTRDVYVTVNSPLPSPSNREQGAFAFSVSSDHPDAEALADGSSVTLRFTVDNWNQAQTVNVTASTAIFNDFPSGSFTRTDTEGFDFQDSSLYDFSYDDTVFEGQRNGVITHLFSAGETTAGVGTDVLSVGVDTIQINKVGLLTANDLLGRSITITEGPGIAESRFIIGVTDNGGSFTLQLQNEWEENKEPEAGTSSFIVRVDDAITGVVDSFTEQKADEIFDDRSTFTAEDANGDPVSFGSDSELIGRTLQIIGGAGAGQELLILEHTDTELTLNGIWTINPVEGESIFRIERYDGLQSQVVEVTINDNDRPGLIVDQTQVLDGTGSPVSGLEAITRVIEGSDGDQRGEADTLNLRLTNQLNGTEEVEVFLNYDATQIKVVAAGDGPDGDALTSVLFDSSILQADGIQVDVYAVDDVKREGAHTAQIDFAFDADGFGGTGDPDETGIPASLVLDVPSSEPQSSIGLEFKPDNEAAIEVNISGVGDLTLGEDFELIAGSNTILFLDDDGLPLERDGIITINYTYTRAGFDSAFAESVLVKIADDDAPTVLVRESDGSTDVIEGGLGGSGGFDTYELVLTKAPTADVTLDLTEIITKSTRTGGIRHDLVQLEILFAAQDGGLAALTNSDALDASGNQVFDSGGNVVTKETFTFTEANWDKPLTVVVQAVNDEVVDGGDTKVFAPGPDTVAQILGPVLVSGAGGNGSLFGLNEPLMLPGEKNIKPPTGDIQTIDNGDGGGAVTVEISRADLTGIVLDDLRIRVDPNDQAVASPLASDDEIQDLIGKTLEITRAPAAPSVVDQFRLIIDVSIDIQGTGDLADDIVTFTLNAPYDLATDEDGTVIESLTDLSSVQDPLDPSLATDGDALVNRYAITSESLNFFVREEESVDFLFVHDGDSPADDIDEPVVLTANRLTGLNMGPDRVIGEVARQGGITFFDLEVLDITLGSGYNDVDVKGTPTRSDGFPVWTIIRTGEEIADPNQPGVRVGDTVNVTLNEIAVDIDSGTGFTAVNPEVSTGFKPLLTITDGSTYADGELVGQRIEIGTGETAVERRIISNIGNVLELDSALEDTDGTGVAWRIYDPADGNLSVDLQGGEDLFDATGSTKGLVAFGGAGEDELIGGLGNDILFGDVGRVDFRSPNGNIVTRLGETPDVITGFVVSPFPQAGDGTVLNTNQTIFPVADTSSGLVNDPSETADTGLEGLYVDINNGTGFLEEVRLITSNTSSQMTVDPAFVLDLDGTSEFRISTTPEDQTDGVIYAPTLILAVASDGGADDVISAGGGNDVAIGGEGEDDIAGDDGNDILFGDLGVVEYAFDPLNPAEPAIGDVINTLRSSVRSIGLERGADDEIDGGAGADVLLGGAGSDDLFGDSLNGDAGGLDGNDIIIGDAGLVKYAVGEFDAGSGSFSYSTVERVESYRTNGAADDVSGNAGSDIIIGGLGGDTVHGDAAIPVAGLDGNDVILGDNGAIVYDVSTTPGASILQSLTGVLENNPEGGADTITGDAGSDVILGGSDADTLHGDDAAGTSAGLDLGDILIGDTGKVVYNTFTGASVLRDVESLDVSTASGGDDDVTGNAGNDILIGGIAQDSLYGDALDANVGDVDGDDLILGDNGELRFGDDGVLDLMASYEDGLGDDDEIAGNAGNDRAIGGYGNDIIDGNGAGNLAPEADGDDILIGDNGEIVLEAVGQVAEIRSYDVDTGFAADDTIQGHGGSDVIIGGLGADDLHGDASDLTTANDAADVILGDNGELFYNDTFQNIPGDGDPAIDYSTLDLVRTTEVGQGDGDNITASIGDDLVLGGRSGDRISAGTEDDLVLGDFVRTCWWAVPVATVSTVTAIAT